jgi:cytochrome P450
VQAELDEALSSGAACGDLASLFSPPYPSPSSSPSDMVALQSTISSLPYLAACIDESQRLWPILAGGPARDLTTDVEHEGYILPKGATVIVHFYSLFRQPWIDDADSFVPERWLPGSAQLPELKQMFMPFSLGRRACSGQNLAVLQVKLAVSLLLKHFHFDLSTQPEHAVKLEYFLLLRLPQLPMRVTKRNG